MIFAEAAVLFVSLAVLAKSGQLVVDSAARIARATGLGELAIGFILLSFVTTLPESSVTLFSVASGSEGLAIGNLLGSNIANIGVILALAAVFGSVKIRKEMLGSFYFVLLTTSFIPLAALAFTAAGKLVGVAGAASFLFFIYRSIKKKFVFEDDMQAFVESKLSRAAAEFAASVVVLLLSAKFVVSSASFIAYELGVAEAVIGGTIIAVGTSLPELAVTLMAIKKGKVNLALGDALGACMVNISLVFSLVLVFAPFQVNLLAYETILAFLLAANLLLFVMLRRERLARRDGIVLLALYCLYVAALLFESSLGIVPPVE